MSLSGNSGGYKKGGYIYYSFTTKLVKCDLEGNLVGTVENIVGHLGCIDFNERDGRIYASLEYKNDGIGRGILNAIGRAESNARNGFYVAVFDVDKIDREGLDAERDGVMRAVYLKDVVRDYEGFVQIGGASIPHIHGCSGIDGLTFGRDFGATGGKYYLHVCYGIYSDIERTDNDYQVILQYDTDEWDDLEGALAQDNIHTCGPEKPRRRYFVYTGNTTYGIQNFEYDEYTGDYIACVYPGKKEKFPNYPAFVIDGSVPAREETLIGYEPEARGSVLTLKDVGEREGTICGLDFAYGSTGICSLGDGRFYISEEFSSECGEATNVCLYELHINDGRWSFDKATK